MRIKLTNLISPVIAILILLASVPLTAAAATPLQAAAVRFSLDSQISTQPLQLRLTNSGEGAIRFTTNGALPNANSTPYVGPFSIDESTVIRAQVFDAWGLPAGDVYTKSYLVVGYEQTIPVVSVVADWGDLDTLHANATQRGREWERPINIEYFEPGGALGFNVKAGIRIHGGRSRAVSPKKSYRIYFRKSYGGPGRLGYALFEDSVVTKFDKLVLRAGYNDTFSYLNEELEPTVQSTGAAYIRDQVVRNLHRDLGQPIAHGSWVLLYLNGEFWGLYNLAERIDLQFLQSYSDKNSQWDIIEKAVSTETGEWISQEVAKDGNYGGWLDNQNWVGGADFSNPANIDGLEWWVEMENVFSLIKVYSPHDSISRILEKPFIHNCGLKVRFVNRAREYLGVENLEGKPADQAGQLSKEPVRAEVLRQAAIVRPFIQMEADRWAPGTGIGVELWEHNIDNVLTFVDEREDVILGYLDELRYKTFTECK